jgi:hypothetical protein
MKASAAGRCRRRRRVRQWLWPQWERSLRECWRAGQSRDDGNADDACAHVRIPRYSAGRECCGAGGSSCCNG